MKFLKSSIVCFLVLIFLFGPIYNSIASNVYEKVIEDPMDTQNAFDIKEVYVKDEPAKIFFKVYPYGTFDFKKDGSGLVGLSIDIDGTSSFESFDPFEYLILMRKDGSKNTIHTYKWIHGATGGLGLEEINLEVSVVKMDEVSDFVEFSLKKDAIDIKDKKKISFNVQSWKHEGNTFYLYDRAPESSLYVYELGIIRPSKPTLQVSAEELNLGTAPFDGELTGKFTITNIGTTGKLEGTIKPSTGKLKLSVDKFSLSFLEKLEVSVSVAGKDFGAKEFLEKLIIESNGGAKTINVKFKFISKPELDYSPYELNFGEVNKGEKATLELNIRNKKEGPIKGSLKTDLNFISFSKKSFEAESVKIKIEADTSLVEPGEYNGTININSNGGDAEIPVTIKVVSAKLEVEPESLDFGDVVISDTQDNIRKVIIIKNYGNKTLEGSIASNVDWLEVEQTSFSIVEKGSLEVGVVVDLKLLEPGKSYAGVIDIKSNGGDKSVPVKIKYLEAPPILSIFSKDSKELKNISATLKEKEAFSFNFIVKNNGGGKLDVEIRFKEENTIFKVSSSKFSIKSGESKEVILTSKEPLQKGEYKDTLVIKSNGGEGEIPINVLVQREKLLIKLYIGSKEAYINDKKVLLDVPPYIKNGVTLVPIRFISEAFGAEVFWDANIGKGQVKIIFEGKTIILLIDSKKAYVDGKEFPLIEAPEIKNGRTFVPIRFISEAFGASVNWNAELKEVSIEL